MVLRQVWRCAECTSECSVEVPEGAELMQGVPRPWHRIHWNGMAPIDLCSMKCARKAMAKLRAALLHPESWEWRLIP